MAPEYAIFAASTCAHACVLWCSVEERMHVHMHACWACSVEERVHVHMPACWACSVEEHVHACAHACMRLRMAGTQHDMENMDVDIRP
eukprot:1159405-Pelagomonas_calceolata.AAC.2